MSNEDFIKQLTSVTGTYELVSNNSQHKDLSDVEPQVLSNILSRSKAAVARVAGSDSEYYKDIETIINTNTGRYAHLHQKVLGAIGSVYALKDDLSNGYVAQKQSPNLNNKSSAFAMKEFTFSLLSLLYENASTINIVDFVSGFQEENNIENTIIKFKLDDLVRDNLIKSMGHEYLSMNGGNSSIEKPFIYASITLDGQKRFETLKAARDSENFGKRLTASLNSIRKTPNENLIDAQPMEMTKDLTKVFIVHGHDEQAETEVARFIERLGFTPIILHEQVSSGKTIIEKIEAHSNVGFAVVLYTPCDVGAVKGKEAHLQPRARQNVIFEHGYLIGKLGRQNVCALAKGEIEFPTDMSGIVYTPMDTHKGWHTKLAKEMKACAYPVDMNKL